MQSKEVDLGVTPVKRLLFVLAVPAITSQVVNALYNMVDRVYIGHIPGEGAAALTGVGICFPIIMIVSAFAYLVGMGGAPRASIFMGKQDKETAEKILGNCFGALVITAAILTVLLLLFNEPLLYLFGASENTIGYAGAYITIYALGTVFVQATLGLNAFISAQGFAKVSMMTVVIGAVTNIVLDPILIFGCQMGVKGAALATIFSQALSAAWVVRFLASEKSAVRLRFSNMKFRPEIIGQIAALGISPFIMQSTESLVSITLNSGLQRYGGDLYVGTMSIMTSIMQLIVIPIQGVAQGVQPIISYNYGAGNAARVKEAFSKLITICFVGTLLLAGIAVGKPGLYARIFTDNQELIELTCSVMPVYFLGITIFGIQSSCQSTFLALGQAKVSLFIALLRKVILLIPLAIILPRYMGVIGIYRAEPIADIISVLTTTVLFFITFKKIMREMKENVAENV